MERSVLIVTAMDGAENLARALSRELNAVVEIARSRRAAVARVRRGPVIALLLDTALPETEVTSSDMLWQNAGEAVPLEVSLAALGIGGVVRLLRSVLHGRQQAETLGRREAAAAIAQDLQSTITCLLLQSDMLLREKAVSPVMAQRIREVRELADTLRTRLRPPQVNPEHNLRVT